MPYKALLSRTGVLGEMGEKKEFWGALWSQGGKSEAAIWLGSLGGDLTARGTARGGGGKE